MTYSYTKEAGYDNRLREIFLLTNLGDHSNRSGCVLEAPVSMEGEHLQSGLVQPPPLYDPLLQPLSHIQISTNWRAQGDSLVDVALSLSHCYVCRQHLRMLSSTVKLLLISSLLLLSWDSTSLSY